MRQQFNREIKSVMTFWWFTTENGEEFKAYEKGVNGVVEIEYFTPRGGRPYVDIHFHDNTKIRSYMIAAIGFGPKKPTN